MTLLVEYIHDAEVDRWGFSVPSLNLLGGMDETREAAERHCLEVIADILNGGDLDGAAGEVVEYEVDVRPAVAG